MQLTTFTDYSLRALLFMANLPSERLTSITQVTEFYGVSRHHMVKVINRLGQLGYIETLRGKGGGIRLAKTPESIIIGEIVRQLEPLHLLDCSQEACVITSACRLKKALAQAREAFLAELDQHTLADMINDNTPLYRLLLTKLKPDMAEFGTEV